MLLLSPNSALLATQRIQSNTSTRLAELGKGSLDLAVRNVVLS